MERERGKKKRERDLERKTIAGRTPEVRITHNLWSRDCHMTSPDRRERPDPTKAPDPEDPSEDFSEESVTTLVAEETKFQPPDDTTITLDNCE